MARVVEISYIGNNIAFGITFISLARISLVTNQNTLSTFTKQPLGEIIVIPPFIFDIVC